MGSHAMKKYQLERYGKLLITRAAIGDKDGTRIVRLMVDTGSSYTILPLDPLEAIGSNPSIAKDKVRILTASGLIVAPTVRVGWINCLGHRTPHFRVTAYTLPFGIFVDGLLGMDLLMKIGAVIHTAEGMIEVF